MKSLFIVFIALLSAAHAQDLEIVGWNVESGGSHHDTIAAQLAEFRGADVICLLEVDPDAEETFGKALNDDGHSYGFQMTEEGGNDRMMVMYREETLTLDTIWSVKEISLVTYRPMLVAGFTHKETGQKFFVGTNHLARGCDYCRQAQSRALSKWQWVEPTVKPYPVIYVGDYNYDWDVQKGDEDHNNGYDALTYKDYVTWVRPEKLILTQCSAQDNGTCKYDSVLDFIFINKTGKEFFSEMSSTIVVRDGDFPDNEHTADHRAVKGSFTFK